MTTTTQDPLLESLHRAGGLTGATDLTDRQLLDRFVARHEEAAFEALLLRYGPLVLGVCRRVLHDTHDADDAFQATFLVLARKAASIAKRQSVGSWLYGVAYRIAVKAKIQAQRRRAYERHAVQRPTADPLDELLWRDLRPVLDEEVNRLPEKYRAPVLLCFLEGIPYAEAARQLGCSKGTIALRLAQARDRLRGRLSRRGVALSVALFPALLTPHRAKAPVPAVLQEATAQVALRWAISHKAAVHTVPPSVAMLSEAALSALAWTRLKIAVTLVLAASVVGGGTGVVVHRVLAGSLSAEGNATATAKKGRKTLQDRQDGLPAEKKGAK
jgi:RNA polymerase sigma factor (sigma-70 family)